MSIVINSFLFIFFTAFAIDSAISGIQLLHIIIIFFSAIITSLISYKIGIIKKSDELSFLYLNLYSLFIKKYFTDFTKMTLSIYKPFLINFDPSPTLFNVEIENYGKINKTVMASLINMTQGLLLYDINKEGGFIYCLNETDYTDLNLLRLTKDIKDINDNNLV